MSNLDYPDLYHRIGRLLETAPKVTDYSDLLKPEFQQWMGRALVSVKQVDMALAIKLSAETSGPNGPSRTALRKTIEALYQAMAECEINMPAGASGAFIPVGNAFDAFTALSKVFRQASKDVLLVDPYLDETVLTDFGLAVPESVPLRLLTDDASHKPSLIPAARRWVAQHGAKRPLQVRLATAKALHDRAIFVDGTTAWTVTQSLKDLAKRSPAEIIRADDIAALKIPAYEAVWSSAKVVC